MHITSFIFCVFVSSVVTVLVINYGFGMSGANQWGISLFLGAATFASYLLRGGKLISTDRID